MDRQTAATPANGIDEVPALLRALLVSDKIYTLLQGLLSIPSI
jgi:hypothetical protein